MSIDHADDDVGGIDRLQRLDDAELLDRFFDARTASHAGGIDQCIRLAIALERHEHRIARGAGLIERDQALFAEQTIDQRRLADVRPADDRDSNVVLSAGRGGAFRQLDAFERIFHQRPHIVAVLGGDRSRLAQAERIEVRAGRRRVDALGFVRNQEDFLVELAQRLRDVVIVRRHAAARVDQKQNAIGLFDRAQRLLDHVLLDALRVDDQAAGIDDDIRNRADFAVAVVTIAREARHVRDERVAGAREEVE